MFVLLPRTTDNRVVKPKKDDKDANSLVTKVVVISLLGEIYGISLLWDDLNNMYQIIASTRLDIAFAVNACDGLSNRPMYSACRTLLQILDYYVDNTVHLGIMYRVQDFNINSFSESD